MVYDVVRSVASDRDLEMIFDHLVEAYISLGEPVADAIQRAGERIRSIEAAMAALGTVPHQGTLLQDIMPGLRSVTKDQAIFYFDVDGDKRVVRVFAVFFGGQDHRRHMLGRLR
jgi:plasmid stabilization system protein ParE